MKRFTAPTPKSKSAIPVPLNAPEVEALNVGLLAVELGANAALVAVGVVALGDLSWVSFDVIKKADWRLLRGVVVRLFCPYSDADSDSYGNRKHNCGHQYPEPLPRHPAY